MQQYQESNPYQSVGGGGGFNPVHTPDVAGAMERELRAGERRDQAYYNSLAQNDKTAITNAGTAADSINKNIETNLKALSTFSKKLDDTLWGLERNRIVADAQAAAMKGYSDPVFAEGETGKYEADEKKVEQGQVIMNEAAVKYEQNGGSPIVGERLRTSFTGRNRIAYERARMENLAGRWPAVLAQNLGYINGTTDEAERARREQAVINDFLTKTGAIGINTGMLNKYLLRKMRQTNDKALLNWTTKTETEILNGRIDEAKGELFSNGIQSGNVGDAGNNFMQTLKSLGYSDRQAKEELFKFLGSSDNEQFLRTADVDALADQPIEGHPAGKTWGQVFGKELNALRGKVIDNQDKAVSDAAIQLKANQDQRKNEFNLEKAKLEQAGGKFTNEQIEQLKADWVADGLGPPPSFYDDYITAEEGNVVAQKAKLKAIWQKDGFITQDDLNNVSHEVRQDKDVQKWMREGSTIAGQSQEQAQDVKDGIKRLTDTISGVTNTEGRTGWKYDKIFKGVRNDVNSLYRAKLASGKYTSEDGTVNYAQALDDSLDEVRQNAKIPGTNENGKDYVTSTTQDQRNQRGSREYIERVQTVRDGIANTDGKWAMENSFLNEKELIQSRDAILNGTGEYPGILVDLADGMTNTTAYDLAMLQLNLAVKGGNKEMEIFEQPSEEIVRAQEAGVQRMLNYKVNPLKTERTFTPSYTASYSLNKNLNRANRALIQTVMDLEGTKKGGYATVYGSRVVPQILKMTLRELYDAGRLGGHNRIPARLGGGTIPWKVDQHNSSASGALQLMPETLKSLVMSGRYSWDDVFSPETQDRMILDLARGRGVDPDKPLTLDGMRRLGGEWASFTPQYGQTSRTASQSLNVYNGYYNQ